VKHRGRPHSVASWRTCPNYAADTVSSLQLKAGHSATGQHNCASDNAVVCSRFRKSPTLVLLVVVVVEVVVGSVSCNL